MAKKPAAAAGGELDLLTRLVGESYDRRAWHGPNLQTALRGVDARLASWRPAKGRHTIWELMLHTAFWHFAVVRRLTGDSAPFDAHPRGSDWPAAPAEATEAGWRDDLALLSRHHRRLLATIATLDRRGLHRSAAAHRQSPALLLRGLACHNLYHAGQIQLLRRLAPA